jgi:hypothetical protein
LATDRGYWSKVFRSVETTSQITCTVRKSSLSSRNAADLSGMATMSDLSTLAKP